MSVVGKKFPSIAVNAIDEMGDTFQIDVLTHAINSKKKSAFVLVPERFYFRLSN